MNYDWWNSLCIGLTLMLFIVQIADNISFRIFNSIPPSVWQIFRVIAVGLLSTPDSQSCT